jgi:hypothetical protein
VCNSYRGAATGPSIFDSADEACHWTAPIQLMLFATSKFSIN